MIIKCAICQQDFSKPNKRYNYDIKLGRTEFTCSKECQKELLTLRYKENSICPQCNRPYLRSKKQKRKQKFCSQACANIYVSTNYVNHKENYIFLEKFRNSEQGKVKIKEAYEKIRKYKKCSICDSKFYGHKKYCSLKCLKIGSKENISNTRRQMFADGNLEVTGGKTKWLNYKDIKVQGSYELRACTILDKLKELGLIKDWKRSGLRVKYIGEDNKEHSYLIDFEIIKKSGKILYLEVKGYIQTKDILKWEATRKTGRNLIVWMNKNLNRIESKILYASFA